jgi:hypothetical protein
MICTAVEGRHFKGGKDANVASMTRVQGLMISSRSTDEINRLGFLYGENAHHIHYGKHDSTTQTKTSKAKRKYSPSGR